jgi:hypothetical protein
MHDQASDRLPQDLNALQQRLDAIRACPGTPSAVAHLAAQNLGAKAESSQEPLRSLLLMRMERLLEQALQLEPANLDGVCPKSDQQGEPSLERLADLFHSSVNTLEPAVLPEMRRIHARIKARQQLRSSLAQPLGHAGPLHSEKLVQQSLHRMLAMSEHYLHRFMGYVDALIMMEDAGQPAKRAAPGQGKKAGRS